MHLKRLFVMALVAAAACGPDPKGDDDGNGIIDGGLGFIDAKNGEFTPDGGPTQQCTKIDFVFVIDDSGSMSEEQQSLATNFPMFINVINQYMTQSGQTLDYRIAITTTGRTTTSTQTIVGFPPPTTITEQGDNGAFRNTGSCGMTRRWFERNDANVNANFACAAKVGIEGPSFEMPLMMMDWSLNKRVMDGTNANFLRPDALLAIVILTDEDDCSNTGDNYNITIDPLTLQTTGDPCVYGSPSLLSVQSFIQGLDTLKGARGRWATAVIAGQQACSTSFGNAAEAKRLKDFVQMAGSNAVFGDICQANLAGSLQQALQTFTAACDNFPPVE